jgi:hypothetical protein
MWFCVIGLHVMLFGARAQSETIHESPFRYAKRFSWDSLLWRQRFERRDTSIIRCLLRRYSFRNIRRFTGGGLADENGKTVGSGGPVKTPHEVKAEAVKLQDQLNHGVIDLGAFRQLWKDLDQYVQAHGSTAGGQPNTGTVVRFDSEILMANAALRQLYAELFDLINCL